MQKLRQYYSLTKPGIIKGNVLVASAAYVFGAQNHIVIATFLGLLVGTSSIIAAGCVVNNYFDRHIDKHMKRTSQRALVTGAISAKHALIFAMVLGCTGVLSLYTLVNLTTLIVGLVGFISYAFVYTFAKHTTVHATLIGTVPGATPPVAGYAAATNHIDAAAIILFMILVVWQMAHFYAISIFRAKEYQAATVPVMSIVKGIKTTRKYIIGYILAFICIAPLLSVTGYTGFTYGVVMAGIGIYWLHLALRPAANSDRWAKRVFGFSLIILLLFSALLVLDTYLP